MQGGETAVTSNDDGLNASTPEAEKDGSSRTAAYDPGASEVNQLNRIKLMLSTAIERRNETGDEGETLELRGIDFDAEDSLGGDACGCGTGELAACGCGGGEETGHRVVGLGMPGLPARRGAAFR